MRKLKRTAHLVPEMESNTRPAEEHIRQRAYEIHKARGGGSGRKLDDWLQAERELLAELEHADDSDDQSGRVGNTERPPPAFQN